MSASPPKADIAEDGCHVRLVPKANINCRDCDVRSLAGPEPDRQVFAKFKHLLRKAAARWPKPTATQSAKSSEHLRPPNAPPISETQPMPNPKRIML